MTITLDTEFVNENIKQSAETFLPYAKLALDHIINKQCKMPEMTGWFNWPEDRGFDLVNDIKSKLRCVDAHYDLVLVIGNGEFYLGTRAVAEALNHEYALAMRASGCKTAYLPIAYAGHHLSESSFLDLLDLLDSKLPIVNVISKTGITTETSLAFRVIRQYMEKRFGEDIAKKRIIVTTDQDDGVLRKIADKKGYLSFPVPDDVGGSYSVLTAVGMVPLALAGYDIEATMNGADIIFKQLKKSNLEEQSHPALEYASLRVASWNHGKHIELMAFSEPKLKTFVEWWKQLMSESEGKDGKDFISSGMSCVTDLHSIDRYAQERCRNTIETFLVLKNSGGGHRRLLVPDTLGLADGMENLEGRYFDDLNYGAMIEAKKAHFGGQVECLELQLDRLNESGMGKLFAFMMTVCAVGCLRLSGMLEGN